MPRGSKPGERRGGRQRGTPNKKTALMNAALAAAAANPAISPLDFLLSIVRNPKESSKLRIKVALATLPFAHAKPGSARPGDPAGTARLIDGTGAFTIDIAVAKALRDDYHRLGELQRKKCGDPLSAEEVEEESKLRARIGDSARAIVCPAGYGQAHIASIMWRWCPARRRRCRGSAAESASCGVRRKSRGVCPVPYS
jgi:hypothetical protein